MLREKGSTLKRGHQLTLRIGLDSSECEARALSPDDGGYCCLGRNVKRTAARMQMNAAR